MSETLLYHNPRCSKSRQTHALLTERGIGFEEVRYLDAPPDEATLRALVGALDVAPDALVRTTDAAFESSGLDPDALDADAVVSFLLAHPQAMQRPVVVHAGRARIGRPPEHVLGLFGDR